ncbi:hypothetical protein F5141DRAFT_1066788 [Pisolithus sp. B1]|nr:hypothetical protein F5141DRAFT_1066788 [Pisolithus sp. B1]
MDSTHNTALNDVAINLDTVQQTPGLSVVIIGMTEVVDATNTTTEGSTGSAMEVVAGTTEDIEDEGRDTSEKDTGTNDKEVMTTNEAEVSKGKGKEVIEGSDKHAYEEGQPKKKITKEKMKGKKASPAGPVSHQFLFDLQKGVSKLVSADQELPTKPIQELVNCIDSYMAHATLGYALMTVMDNNDLGWGPKMEHQQVNLHDIDAKFMASFIRGINKHGLRNWCMENAVDVGIKFTNCVKWLEGAVNTKAILYNCNHHITYMQGHSSYMNMFNQHKLAEMRLGTGISDVLKAPHQDAFNKAGQKEGGVWLATTVADSFRLRDRLIQHHDECVAPIAFSSGMTQVHQHHSQHSQVMLGQAIIMLDFLAAPADFQDVSKDVPPDGDILAAFEAEYQHLSSKFDKPIQQICSPVAAVVLEKKAMTPATSSGPRQYASGTRGTGVLIDEFSCRSVYIENVVWT